MNIKCIIVEDEPNAAKLLEEYVNKIPFLDLRGICTDSEQALEKIDSNIELVLLDINLPGLTGIELVNLLPKNVKIIFITAYSQYAVDSYEKNAVDYLLKPISFNRFLSAITKVKESLSPKSTDSKTTEYTILQESFFIKAGYQTIQINFKDLKYIEGSKEYIFLHTHKEKHMCYKRMKEMAERLPDYFVRVHHSFIINIHHISKIDTYQILIQETKIPLGPAYKEHFFAAIKKYFI
ncbi:LytR/AlgR family response regulator transcription factor [Chryseobacterium sp. DT-3]|uniref:LytR/AlgR family response regulator transcription factor n=1 Tax=Chryseobacterium sp. DT-3 TaxID=3396164 RepID=UPI003F1E085A